GFEFWELTENGGNEWRVEDMPGDCGHDFINSAVTKYFTTSFELCLKKQVIDLVAEGYDPDDLDNQPAVTIEDWFCSRTDCGCMYQLSVSLLNENAEVLQEHKPDMVILDPDSDDCSWRQVTKIFTDYGPEGLDYWQLTENGGSGWQVEDMSGEGVHAFNNSAVTKYFSTSYELNLKKQVIDLVAEGYNPDDLDNQPAVTIEDWFCCRTDCGCMYQIAVSLLDANSQPLQEYKPDVVILDPDSDDCSWRK
ncbi:F-box only protein 2-like, partial [Clarias magur]